MSVLEAGSPRSRRQQFQCLGRDCFHAEERSSCCGLTGWKGQGALFRGLFDMSAGPTHEGCVVVSQRPHLQIPPLGVRTYHDFGEGHKHSVCNRQLTVGS